MSNKIKLNCPMCQEEFVTVNTNQIWCSKYCSKELTAIKKRIEENRGPQERIKDKRFRYDFDSNKWFVNFKTN